ncbi:MAG: response regulator [Methylococcales bacterium]|nr:response regulator [Methylococcales bacterium]
MVQRILIVDDDARLRNLVSSYLEKQGFETLVAADSVEMKKLRERFDCHLLVLDVNMPGESGLAICQRLRAEGDVTPIIILTACNETVDRIIGLEFGADDYLTKPFDPRELVARIKAVLRRTPDVISNANEAKNLHLKFGPFLLDGQTRRLSCNGQPVALSQDEFTLLMLLASTPGKPLSRNQLASQIKGKGSDQAPDQRNIDMLISRLRKRLEDDPTHPRYISTVRCLGYAFTDDSIELIDS